MITRLALRVLTLLQLKRIGPARIMSEGLAESGLTRLEQMLEISYSDNQRAKAFDLAAQIVDRCEMAEIGIISIFDTDYPARLKLIKNPPVLLYWKGAPKAMIELDCAAVVGTREASSAGEKYAMRVATALVECGFCIVSGLAIGIDSHAHEAALAANGITVAVLAHGLDQITPARNRPLGKMILEKGGCLVSEHAPGVPPRPPEYAKRNRIQSGLSLFSVVVETGKVGGTIHQARFTCEQERGLVVIRPKEHVPGLNVEGADFLIEQFGATRISAAIELRDYAISARDRIERNQSLLATLD